jgi:hypothetical protein
MEIFAEVTPQKPNATDAAAERETVITWSDADQVISVHTSQAKVITQLTKNAAATLVWRDGDEHRFELPLGLVTLRNGKRSASKTAAPRRGRAKNIRTCSHVKDDGTKCGMIAKKDSKGCRWHPDAS